MKRFSKYLGTSFVAIVACTSIVLINQFDKRMSSIQSNEQELVEVTYKTVINAYEKNAQILFASTIDRDDVKSIFYKASIAQTNQERDKYRKELYNRLSGIYDKLKYFDIEQLHFHLANNDSFLPFHRPDKYGDNLSDLRKTVAYVNKEHKRISSFEEGRIFNGYRFVFPVNYNGIHIGSVETAISMKVILNTMQQNINSKVSCIIDKKIVNKNVFKAEHKNYKQSKVSENYLYDRSMYTDDAEIIEKLFSNYKLNNKNYEEVLAKGEAFTFMSKISGTHKVTTFFPVKNVITNETVAYLIDSRVNKNIKKIRNYFIVIWFSIVLTTLLIFIAIFRVKSSEKAASAAAKTKSVFLANMSHEIRTPMNAIIGFADILHKSQLDDEQKKHLGYIKSSSENLLVIINDILDFSKIEAGKLELECMSFNMNELCSHIHAILEMMAMQKDIKFIYDYQSTYDGEIMGDPTRVNQIFINLLNNAIKFTDRGQVKVIVNTIFEDNDRIIYQAIIQDTGIGMSEETIKKLFNSFEQADSTINRKFGGTGLGLSITNTLVKMMDGKISVESTEDVGSEFVVKIGFDKSVTLENEQDKQEVCEEMDLSSLNVLVVEDNKTNQVLIDIILDECNIEAVIVNDGQEAVDLLASKTFDLILMDIQMPNLNGYEATKIIRDENSDVLDHNVEIVAISANARTEDVKLSYESGMNGHIAKPIDVIKLRKVLFANFNKGRDNG
ncbi:ATP-binding protein [Sulfurimonas sp.]|nr:ATP-binding protein [Sulfurimonas sp.]